MVVSLTIFYHFFFRLIYLKNLSSNEVSGDLSEAPFVSPANAMVAYTQRATTSYQKNKKKAKKCMIM